MSSANHEIGKPRDAKPPNYHLTHGLSILLTVSGGGTVTGVAADQLKAQRVDMIWCRKSALAQRARSVWCCGQGRCDRDIPASPPIPSRAPQRALQHVAIQQLPQPNGNIRVDCRLGPPSASACQSTAWMSGYRVAELRPARGEDMQDIREPVRSHVKGPGGGLST